jgi:mRNA interferase HigB
VEVVGAERIEEFAGRFPMMKRALLRWLNAVEAADWKNSVEMKKTFGFANIVSSQTVFDVGGNKCRLIALIHYGAKRVLVQHVLTHQEYNKGDWKR